jgi:hypothetical protein
MFISAQRYYLFRFRVGDEVILASQYAHAFVFGMLILSKSRNVKRNLFHVAYLMYLDKYYKTEYQYR